MAEYCPGCMKKMSGGECRTSWCRCYVQHPKAKAPKVGSGTGQLRAAPGGTLEGNKGKKEPTGVDTGLVIDRGKQEPRSEHPGITKAKERAEKQSAKSKPKRLAKDKAKARKEARRAIGKTPKEGSYDPDTGGMSGIEGTKIEIVKGLFGGRKAVIVKDEDSDIWEDD